MNEENEEINEEEEIGDPSRKHKLWILWLLCFLFFVGLGAKEFVVGNYILKPEIIYKDKIIEKEICKNPSDIQQQLDKLLNNEEIKFTTPNGEMTLGEINKLILKQ